MAYSVTTTDGLTPITVADSTVDSSQLSLSLIGRNATNYGEPLVRNFVHHLENFSNSTAPAPTTTLEGQLWWNKTEKTLRVYDGTTWGRSTGIPVSSTEITSNLVGGTGYFNSVTQELKMYNGTEFKNALVPGGTVTAEYAGNVTSSGNASNYGAKVETLFLTSSGPSPSIKPVLAMKYVSDGTAGGAGIGSPDANHENANTTIMAIFSSHDTFSVDATSDFYAELSNVNSFGASITQGFTLRNDYTDAIVAQALLANVANVANAIDTGVIVDGTDIIHVGRGYVPTTDSTFNIGSGTFRFGEGHFDTLYVGGNVAGNTPITIVGNVDIGSSSSRVNALYATDLDVSGNVTFGAGSQNIGTPGAPVENMYVANITIGATAISNVTPSANTHIANKLYVDTQVATVSSGFVDKTSVESIGGTKTFTDTVTAPTFAGIATQIQTSQRSVAASHYLTFVTDDNPSATGETLYTDAGVSYNPSTNVLSATATSAQYADLAEIYSSDALYEPGTVVKMGGEAEVTSTTSRYDYNVFGVVSTNPAYLMNDKATGLPIALVGRVPVKVTGSVKKGDRLISSNIPGVAEAIGISAYDARGIIGRALQDKNGGDLALIEVVIGVQ